MRAHAHPEAAENKNLQLWQTMQTTVDEPMQKPMQRLESALAIRQLDRPTQEQVVDISAGVAVSAPRIIDSRRPVRLLLAFFVSQQ